ncbi:hypothetical protein FRC0084_00687 [Corynebacterium diphtheriae]|nr:hypothetical protein FRC0084_00687 [Corynebacterium diphtheriae]
MRRIELITCGVDQIEEAKAQHLHAPVVDARILPDPSEEVGDLFGTDPTVMLCIAMLDPQGAIKTINRINPTSDQEWEPSTSHGEAHGKKSTSSEKDSHHPKEAQTTPQ